MRLAIIAEAAVSGPVKFYCSRSATRRPPCAELNCPEGKLIYIKVFPPRATERLYEVELNIEDFR
jgi:hypothetical protein